MIFSINVATLRDFMINILLLFGMVLLYQVSRFQPRQKGWFKNIIVGLFVGLIGVLTMMFPFKFNEGLFFDARSVLYLISGYFFGPIVTIIGAAIGLGYRIYVGGGGVYAGVATIFVTSLIGISWKYVQTRLPKSWSNAFNFYLMGFIGHIAAITCQLLIVPFSNAIPAIRLIAVPFLVFYPIATLILALSINNHINRLLADESIKQQKLLLQSSIDSAQNIQVFALDKSMRYLTFNESHAQSIQAFVGRRPTIGQGFLDNMPINDFSKRLRNEIKIALEGKSYVSLAQIETSHHVFFETHYSPIIDAHHQIIGVSVFSQDVTKRINDEKEIVHLSYHDPLTNLKNRRFYQEEIARLEEKRDAILTFVLFDINGLKIMNDAFGHQVGDVLLQRISQVVNDTLPENSILIRIGGDEFVIIFYGIHELATEEIIERIDGLIRNEMINGISFSVSFGVAERQPNEKIAETIRRAEKKMYTKKLGEVTSSRHETIRAILNTLHVKSKREESHSLRVSLISQKIGEALNLRREEIDLLKMMANLHDIGKIAIDAAILNKPGPLNDHEWSEIKKHPETGYHILLASPEYAEIAEDILSHHERWDGKGYPRGLKGEEIPFRARVIALADSFDAMTSSRPYRCALTQAEAIEEIRRCAGTQFDPNISAKFLEYLKREETDE